MIYVIVLNWNGGADTIECARSVLALACSPMRLVICDNASTDDSLTRLRAWAAAPPSPPNSGEVEAAQRPSAWLELQNDPASWRHPASGGGDVVLIHTGANRGYAGGNNVGLRYALKRGDAEYFWILNNDTVAMPAALSALVAKARGNARLGIVGSTLLYRYRPEHVQVLGGCRFSTWTTQIVPIGWGKTATDATTISETEVEAQLDYVTGASMLVSPAFIADVGLMNEDYFLYFEELDWAERGRRSARGAWKLGYARDSVLLHKVGASAETGSSESSTRYYYTSKIRFMKRFYPARVPMALVMVFLQALKLLTKGSGAHARVILSVLAGANRISAAIERAEIIDAA